MTRRPPQRLIPDSANLTDVKTLLKQWIQKELVDPEESSVGEQWRSAGGL